MLSIFPALEIKKLVLVGKIPIVMFRHDFACMVNSFVASWDIPIMMRILYKMIKVLHKKMLNTIDLYWFHNGTLEENNSQNGYSNEPWING